MIPYDKETRQKQKTLLAFLLLLLFIYSHVHTLFGSFLPLTPLPHFLSPSPLSSRQVLFCLYHSLVLLKKRDKSNKEDKVFLLVELRAAIQKYS
jgi:hypothetical protein